MNVFMPSPTTEVPTPIVSPRHGSQDGQGNNSCGLPGLKIDKALTAGAMRRVLTPADALTLCGAASALFNTDIDMDKVTTVAAFLVMAGAVDSNEADRLTRRSCPPSSTWASRWMRYQKPAPSDVSRPPRMPPRIPSLSVGTRPTSLARASR